MSRFRCLWAAALLTAAVGAVSLLPGCRPQQAAAASGDPLSASRLEALSRAYLGTPYVLGPLGEGSGPDPDPLYTRKAVDCQTFVEQVLAEALAPQWGGRDAAVRRIRYRDGHVSLASRNHYCIPDWFQQPWPARDVTAKVGGKAVVTVKRTIDRPTFLRGLGSPEASAAVKETVSAGYIPRASVKSVEGAMPDGSIAIFVLSKPGIVSGHLGFLFRRNGVLTLRHASQTRKRVMDEPLDAYLTRAPKRFIGMMVLQPGLPGAR